MQIFYLTYIQTHFSVFMVPGGAVAPAGMHITHFQGCGSGSGPHSDPDPWLTWIRTRISLGSGPGANLDPDPDLTRIWTRSSLGSGPGVHLDPDPELIWNGARSSFGSGLGAHSDPDPDLVWIRTRSSSGSEPGVHTNPDSTQKNSTPFFLLFNYQNCLSNSLYLSLFL